MTTEKQGKKIKKNHWPYEILFFKIEKALL